MKVDLNEDVQNENDAIGDYVQDIQLHGQPILSELLSTEQAISITANK